MPKQTTQTITNKKKFEHIKKFISEDGIEIFISQNYSFGMIYGYLKRDTEAFSDEVIKNMTLTSLRNTLLKFGFKVNKEHFDKMPQHWKCQYNYPKEWTLEQVKQECISKSVEGQKLTVKSRKQNNSYNNRLFKREWSPLCTEFYAKRNIPEKEVQQAINGICASGAKAALKTTQSPSTELKIKEFLLNNNIEFSTQYEIQVDRQNPFSRTKLLYDFYIPSKNLLIECNGSYWHCDPRFFISDQEVKFPAGVYKACDIWARDKFKLDFAADKGYNVHTVWEFDLNNNLIELLQDLLKRVK
jgi:G:T-mismatch repair DNA endonuclease (very short patch repair protein)